MQTKLVYVFIISITLFLPFLVSASVVINEIAWMGSKVDSVDSSKWQYYEWIELFNNGNDVVNLTGWTLSIVGKKDISLENTIPANGYYFIERSGYHAFDSVIADLATSFGTGLPNSGATLVLKDAASNPIDTVDGSDNWKIGGRDIIGNNVTKETAQRNGSLWITATGTPKAQNASLSAESGSSSSSGSQSGSSSGGTEESSYVPPENLPKIKAYAGEDKTVIVSANAEFRGQAFGLEDEPLTNARYLWTFGDGASKEGQNVTHIYQYPGEYIVVLNVSSGEYAASDYLLVKAVPNKLFISEIKTGNNGSADNGASWIELFNNSKEQLDISGWQLKSGSKIFIFPGSTLIRPNAYLVIPASVSGLVFPDGKNSIELLYAGGFKADEFNYDGVLKEGQSFNRSKDMSLISQESPGAVNIILAQKEEISKILTTNSNPSKNKNANPPKNSGNLDNSSLNAEDKSIKTEESKQLTASAANSGSNWKFYLFAVLGLIVFSSAGVLFVRQRGRSG